MGILDEAIREHLELKRQHGADDSELRQLEDEAFGPPERPGNGEGQPDPLAEAATEFMEQPDLGEEKAPEGDGPQADASQAAPSRREPAAGVADIQEPPEQQLEEQHSEDEPAEEEQPAAEHEAIPQAPVEHSTEERHAIADQPTEMYDVEEEFASSEASAPSDEDLAAEEVSEPRLAPADPIANFDEIEGEAEMKIEETGAGREEEEEEDFFDEQRLSDELDQALEAPLKVEPEEEEEEPGPEAQEGDELEDEEEPPPAKRPDEDLLEETPDFLEEAPEDDQLWFEQKPPKDFDFDD